MDQLAWQHVSSRTVVAGLSLAKMFGVIAIGMPVTLLSTAQVAFLVRKYVQTEMLDAPTADALPPFGRMHFITWGKPIPNNINDISSHDEILIAVTFMVTTTLIQAAMIITSEVTAVMDDDPVSSYSYMSCTPLRYG